MLTIFAVYIWASLGLVSVDFFGKVYREARRMYRLLNYEKKL